MGKKSREADGFQRPPSLERHVTSATLLGVQKRQKPNKHYVFILEVEWSDNDINIIYRSYSDFYEFHITLLDIFPVEAGVIKQSSRILPFLPGRRLFRRNEVEKVAKKRQVSLGDYCRDLLQLEDRISGSPLVVDFFSATETDINPPTDASDQSITNDKAKSKSETLRLQSLDNNTEETLRPLRRRSSLPDLVFLPDTETGQTKTNSRKSSPKSFSPFTSRFKKKKKNKGLDTAAIEVGETGGEDDASISGPIEMEEYRAIGDYKAVERSEVSLKTGDTVDVIEKHDNGWWFCEVHNNHGWAPASYLEPVHQQLEPDEPEPCFDGDVKYITTSHYSAQFRDEVSFPSGAVVDVMHKLLDGWWIICYAGEVGHAPAAYLQPYNNPLARKTPITKSIKQKVNRFKPIPRRHTIKNRESKWVEESARDMAVYRERSLKKKDDYLKPVPPIPTEFEQQIYQNEEVSDGWNVSKQHPATGRTKVQSNFTHPILTPIKNHKQILLYKEVEEEEDYENIEEDSASFYIPMTSQPEVKDDDLEGHDYYNVPKDDDENDDENYEDDWEYPPNRMGPRSPQVKGSRSPVVTRPAPAPPPKAARNNFGANSRMPFVNLPTRAGNHGGACVNKIHQRAQTPTENYDHNKPPHKAARNNFGANSQMPFVNLPTRVGNDGGACVNKVHQRAQAPENYDNKPSRQGQGHLEDRNRKPPFSQSPTQGKHKIPTKSSSPSSPRNVNIPQGPQHFAVEELKAKLAKQLKKIDTEDGSPTLSPSHRSPEIPKAANRQFEPKTTPKAANRQFEPKTTPKPHILVPKTVANNSPPKPPAKPKRGINMFA